MENLTKTELMLIKMLLINEKNKDTNEHDLAKILYKKNYIQKIEKILEKIS